MIIIANTNIFIGQKILLPPKKICTPKKLRSTKNVTIHVTCLHFPFCEILILSIGFELQNFYPRDEILNLTIHYELPSFKILADIFTGLSVFDSPKGLSNTIKTHKNICLYFRRRYLIIYKYQLDQNMKVGIFTQHRVLIYN